MKILFLIASVVFLAGCQGIEPDPAETPTETPDDSSAGEINTPDPEESENSLMIDVPYESYLKDSNPVVTMEVQGLGTMKLQLFPDVAPNSVNNMIKLVQEGYYDGLIFHRVIENFVIQGGWGELVGKPASACTIAGEFNANGFDNPLEHDRGVLSMARTSVMDSATSQFFIMHQKTASLDGQYAGFGGLIEGFDVLDAIATTATGFQDQPNENIVMEQVTVELNGYVPSEPDCVN
jgi:peptidyl-prolyl cis-trans isomerase B (cyclophilin B)